MKKLIFPIFILMISCSTVEVKEDQQNETKLHIQLICDADTKVNGLYLYEPYVEVNDNTTDDVTNDKIENYPAENSTMATDLQAPKTGNDGNGDLTAMQDKENKPEKLTYINDEKKRAYYVNQFSKIETDIHKKLFTDVYKNRLGIELYKYVPDSTDDINLMLTIKVINYTEGEYNLIKNINTKIKYEVTLSNAENKIIAKFKKSYILVTDFEYPIELLRLSKINEILSHDITHHLKRYAKKLYKK